MKKTGKLAAVAVALTTLVGASAFADSRSQEGTWRGDSNRGYNDSSRRNDSDHRYRDNERVTLEGRVRNVTHERGGYRVELDRAPYGFWVPESQFRGRGTQIRVGIDIRLGGIFRNDRIDVDAIDYPGDGGYNGGYDNGYGYQDNYLRGYVDRVDFRRGILVIRDDSSGRFVTVDMDRLDRRGRGVDLDDLRRGDFVTLSGDWSRGGVFQAYRIENVRSRRY
ncbi:MAG TPA: hypothetical protein VF980_00420 [Thermoanaerobaculia bacterium]